MGLYIQNRKIDDENNNTVEIYPDDGVVIKRFHTWDQYEKEVLVNHVIEQHCISPKMLYCNKLNKTIAYKYIEPNDVDVSQMINALNGLHGLSIKSPIIPTSMQVQEI